MSFQDSFWGPNGFEELRKSVKEGQDFTKDVASILHERCELEISYAKNLCKLSNKLAKATKFAIGTTQHAWQEVAVGMENEAEIHKRLAGSLEEDVIKPMKNILDSEHKHRKCVESTVDKASKILNERRNEEFKMKKLSYSCARENERMQDQALDSKVSKGKLLTEKDIHKLENKRRKAEETLARADVDYYNSCIKAERSRQDHESVAYRASTAFQQLEEERLSHMHDFLQKYANHLSLLGPSLTQGCERLNVAIASVDVTSDLQSMVELKGTGPNVPEQILPDFYAENMNNEMKKERRKETLERFLTILKHDLELERRGKQGVENLAKVFHETPTFGDAEAQQDVFEKLQHVSAMIKRRTKKLFLTGVVVDHRSCGSQKRPIHKMRAMLTYLEASRYKLQCAVAELEGSTRPVHPLSAHMEIKSKQGVCQTVLKVPRWVRLERRNSESSGSAGSDVPDFDLHHEDNRDQVYANVPTRHNSVKSRIQCQALYGYEAKLSDELSFNPGDVIVLREKTQDGWWHGELNGITGVFPSTYVQEM